MAIQFYRGPYDGLAIDGPRLCQIARLVVVVGGDGRRVFALMPPPRAWELAEQGAAADEPPRYPYELVAVGDVMECRDAEQDGTFVEAVLNGWVG